MKGDKRSYRLVGMDSNTHLIISRERFRALEIARAKLAEYEQRKCNTCAHWIPGMLASGRCAYWDKDITAGFSCKAYETKESEK